MIDSKHPFEDLSAEELEDMAAYEHPFTSESTANITARFKEQTQNTAPVVSVVPKRAIKRSLAVALVAVLSLGLFGFVNINAFQDLYYEYFGGGAEIARYAEEIGASTTSDGLHMEVLTALNDGSNTYLFVSLQDLTADRLSEDMFIDQWSLEGGRGLGGGNAHVMSYDPQTKTAVLAVHAIGGQPDKDAIFSLSSLFDSRVEEEVIIDSDVLDLSKLLDASPGNFVPHDTREGFAGGYGEEFVADGLDLEKIPEVLAAGNLDLALPGYDQGVFCNLGYKDGLLHLQMNPNNVEGNEGVWLDLVNKDTGKIIDSYYTLNYGSYPMGEYTYTNDYEETVFKIEQSELANYELRVSCLYFESVIKCDLSVSFKVPTRMDTLTVEVGTTVSGSSGSAELASIEVSPLSVTLHFSTKSTYLSESEITLIYRDGSRVPLGPEREYYAAATSLPWYMHDDTGQTQQLSGPILNYEDLVALDINGTEIALR